MYSGIIIHFHFFHLKSLNHIIFSNVGKFVVLMWHNFVGRVVFFPCDKVFGCKILLVYKVMNHITTKEQMLYLHWVNKVAFFMGCLHLKLFPNVLLVGFAFNFFWYCLSTIVLFEERWLFCDPPHERKHLHRCPTHKLSCNIPSFVALFVLLRDKIYTLPCHLSM
jgi:hypothetical protein